MNNELFILFYIIVFHVVILIFIGAISWIKVCRKVDRILEEIQEDMNKYL